jgi:hypothetical protein
MAVRAVSARLRAILPEQEAEYVGLVYALVLVWGLGDVVSTYFAYAAVGTGTIEVNPWIGVMLEYSPLLVLAVKAAVVLYAGIVLLEAREFVKRTPGWRLWLSGLVVAGTLVVTNNLLVGTRVLLRG